uniref:Uncharacterized protein n=1 Tax=Anguilla anguilla TaxID=7936 RepID=A0A0E9XFZ2_ANGAN
MKCLNDKGIPLKVQDCCVSMHV